MSELSTREAVFEAARMYVFVTNFSAAYQDLRSVCSIYLVHDDAKEREFELEMAWIGPETNGVFVPVPKDLHGEAEQRAKAALETFE